MRLSAVLLSMLFTASSLAHGQELTKEQMGPWSALEEQVALDIKQDWEGMKKFLHPKACFWGDQLPSPVSVTSSSYYAKLRAAEDEIVAHHLVPVSVVVVDDVAIINFYCHVLTQTEDEDEEDGKQIEKIFRGHNTWKKEHGQWLLLATYNTVVETDDDD
jgi:hypothetical protein